MDCVRKALSLSLIYIAFFVLPWMCSIKLLWELQQDNADWSQPILAFGKYLTNTGTIGTCLMSIFLFSITLQILSFGTNVFIFPVVLEICAFGLYTFTLLITVDPVIVVIVNSCSVSKIFYVIWTKYQSKINKLGNDEERYTYCV